MGSWSSIELQWLDHEMNGYQLSSSSNGLQSDMPYCKRNWLVMPQYIQGSFCACAQSVRDDVTFNIPALVQIMAWRWLGDKPLSEPMMVLCLYGTRHSPSIYLQEVSIISMQIYAQWLLWGGYKWNTYVLKFTCRLIFVFDLHVCFI